MKETEIYDMLNQLGLPVAYDHFQENSDGRQSQPPPFIVYMYPGTENFFADGITYAGINQLDVELYTDSKSLEIEKQLEQVLKSHGIGYEKTESYLESEKMYMILYETEVLIDG